MSDWDSVTVLRKRQPKASAMKTEGAINQVIRILFYVFVVVSFLLEHSVSMKHPTTTKIRKCFSI